MLIYWTFLGIIIFLIGQSPNASSSIEINEVGNAMFSRLLKSMKQNWGIFWNLSEMVKLTYSDLIRSDGITTFMLPLNSNT